MMKTTMLPRVSMRKRGRKLSLFLCRQRGHFICTMTDFATMLVGDIGERLVEENYGSLKMIGNGDMISLKSLLFRKGIMRSLEEVLGVVKEAVVETESQTMDMLKEIHPENTTIITPRIVTNRTILLKVSGDEDLEGISHLLRPIMRRLLPETNNLGN